MKKLSGFDLNGWRDSTARNWVVLADGEEREVPSSIVDGGLNGVVVMTGAKANSGFVGGAQAALAPHGLGDGWGTVGAGGKRVKVRSLISGEGSVEQLSAAFRGMAPQADFGVGSLDDHPGITELQQERLIAAMRKARNATPLLVWRSVLAALHAIELGAIEHGQLVGVVNHVADGFTVQKLRIRRENSRGQTLLAPERRAVGKLMASELGYDGLSLRAREAVLSASQTDRSDHLEWAHAHGRLTLGLEASPEVLRLKNGSWEILNPPKELPGSLPAAPAMSQEFQQCDVVLFETLTEGALSDGLFARAASAVGRSPLRLAATAVAQGALTAARRLSRREPVYFDFLPQISTIVQRRDAAENFDLIDPEATLPAGSVYRSPSPARLAIQAGRTGFRSSCARNLRTFLARPKSSSVRKSVKRPRSICGWSRARRLAVRRSSYTRKSSAISSKSTGTALRSYRPDGRISSTGSRDRSQRFPDVSCYRVGRIPGTTTLAATDFLRCCQKMSRRAR